MAIMHLSASIVKRSEGKSAVAAAAYRACEKLLDERQDMTFDYSNKADLVRAEIFLPENAPPEFSDRATLWNTVEATEKRVDSRLAREIQVALPVELTAEQNWALAQEFVKTYFVDKGMISDVAFHAGHGNDQPHLHILLTLREVTALGFGRSAREWNQRELVNTWREGWAELANTHLALNGHDVRIDHRSYADQGIDLIPQNKVGVSANRARREEAKGLTPTASERLAEFNAIAYANGEKIINDPTIALTALSRQQSTFADNDIARLANRQSIDAAQFTAVYQAILQSPELITLGQNQQGEMRYTSREMLTLESEMMQSVTKMANANRHAVANRFAKHAIKNHTLSPSQATVLNAVVQGGDVAAVVGFAGTGKTHLLGAAREAWENAGYRVRGLALAGKAADGLTEEAGITSRTIASHLLAWREDRERLSENDILVIDEAGMVDSRLLKEVIDYAAKAHAKIVLVGDHTQLQPIGAGAAFRAILERIGFSSLTDIRRQNIDWMREASKDLALGRAKAALQSYNQHGFVHEHQDHAASLHATVDSWWRKRELYPTESSTMCAFMRKDVADLNAIAREKLKAAKKLGKDITFTINDGREEVKRSFAAGDEIYFLNNDKGLGVVGVDDTPFGVKNGTRGVIRSLTKRSITVDIQGANSRTITFDIKDYHYFDHAYAATVHKLQGATFDHNDYLPSYNSNRYLSHVALTRHKKTCDIHWSREDFRYGMASLESSFAREAVKDFTLDYIQPRGIASPDADIDQILITEAQSTTVNNWAESIDFSALADRCNIAVKPLIEAKAELDAANRAFKPNDDRVLNAQSELINAALDLKRHHNEQAVLGGLDTKTIDALTNHPALTSLEKNSAALTTKKSVTLQADLDTHFDKVVASFDWRGLEAARDQHPTITQLLDAKLALEASRHDANVDIDVCKTQMKSAIRSMVDTPDIYQAVTQAAPSLTEPLADIEQSDRQKQGRTPLPSFDDIYNSIDWRGIEKHAPNSGSLDQLLKAKANLERAYALNSEKLIQQRQKSLIKDLGKLENLPNIKKKVLSLTPELKEPMLKAHRLYEHERGLSHSRGQGFSL